MTIVQTRLGSVQAHSVKSQPVGNIAATSVQDALEELDAEKLATDSELIDISSLTPTDGLFIVGNGTDFVGESGNTARTSLGMGTGNSPQFAALNIGHASDTTLTRISAGVAAIEGNIILTAANEGSGNGLDADTVDGIEGSEFALGSILSSNSNGEGASTIGIEDPGGNFTATDVEGALAELAGAGGGSGVETAGTPELNDFARFTDADTIEGRSYAEVREDLGLEIGTDVLAQQAIGISNDNLLEVDGDPNSGELAVFTADGLAGLTEAELKSTFNIEAGTDFQAYNANLDRAQLAMTRQAVATSSATLTIDLNSGWHISLSLGHNITSVVLNNPAPSGQLTKITLEINSSGTFTIAGWPGTDLWVGGSAPTITDSGRDSIVLTTVDGGTTWIGYVAGQDFL